MAASGGLSITTRYTVSSSANTLGADTENVQKTWNQELGDGTTANNFDRAWSETRTLTAGTHTYDLTALTGPRGSVSFAEIIEVSINITASTDPATLTLGGEGSADEWTALFGAAGDKLKLRSKGKLVLFAPDPAGYAVGAGNKLFKADSGSSTITFEIIFKGRYA
jgi:hypothetical protein